MSNELLGRLTIEVFKVDAGITGSAKFDGDYADVMSGLFFCTVIEPDLEKMLRSVIEFFDSEKGKRAAENIRRIIKESQQ